LTRKPTALSFGTAKCSTSSCFGIN
jgi:hypothetical protein